MTSQLYFSKLCGDVSGEDMELEREVSRANEVLGMSLTDGHFSEGELYFSNVRGSAGQPPNYSAPWNNPPSSSSGSSWGGSRNGGAVAGNTQAAVHADGGSSGQWSTSSGGAGQSSSAERREGNPSGPTSGQSGSQWSSSGQRGRSPTRQSDRKGTGGVSPVSGRTRLYRRTNSGGFQSLDRASVLDSLVPRAASPSPAGAGRRAASPGSSYGQYKTPSEAARAQKCVRCFRYLPHKSTSCSRFVCSRYKSCPIGPPDGSGLCTCRGGFHPKKICSRQGVPPLGFSRPGSPAPPAQPTGNKFNEKLIAQGN